MDSDWTAWMLLFFSIGRFHFIFQPEVYGHSLQWTILKPHMDPMDDCQVIYVTALAESTLGDLGAEFVVPFFSPSCPLVLKSSWKNHQVTHFFIQKESLGEIMMFSHKKNVNLRARGGKGDKKRSHKFLVLARNYMPNSNEWSNTFHSESIWVHYQPSYR